MSQRSTILSDEEKERYARQLLIPTIGERGQRILKESKVLVAGVGGLGSLSSLYLAAAGIGRIKIVDKDYVNLGNLNRQIIHFTDDIGKKKVDSATDKLRRLNPEVEIQYFHEEITEKNTAELAVDIDLIVDATDNIETRKILNKIAVQRHIPFIYGGVEGLNGMVTTFFPPLTPCFECVFGHIETQRQNFGVIGPVPGIIASIQVLEAIKHLVDLDGRLYGRMLFFSGEEMSFMEIKINRNPKCKICR